MVKNSEGPVVVAQAARESLRQRNPRITQRALQRCIKNVDWTAADVRSPEEQEPSSPEPPSSSSALNPFAPPFVPAARAASSTPALEAVPTTASSALRLVVGAHMIPHPAKAHKGGEDAYFISNDSSVFGIADGVGGWEALGVDSGLYSRSLMGFCGDAVNNASIRDPFEVLKFAHERSACIPGSTTACVVSFSPDACLAAVNLGDSGFIIIRNGSVYYKTKEQQHFFNCPYQIGSSRDQPEDAQRLTVENLQEGDIVVACTDGVFDNLFTEDIVRIVTDSLHHGPHVMAKRVADASSEVANNGDAYTPFQDGALKAGQLWKGGKLDDITVIVAVITSAN